MQFSDLPESERGPVLETLEAMKVALTTRAVGGVIDEQAYKQHRRTLLGCPAITGKLPAFLRACTTPDEFWSYIKPKFTTYAERREYIAAEFNPLIGALEGTVNELEDYLKVGEEIGRGGFGVVFRVHHKHLDLDFALKVFVPTPFDEDPAHLDRFFREARILLALNHPNIVRVYDAGLYQNRPFIRMEYFAGTDVNRVLMQHGTFSAPKAAVLAAGISEAIAHAHSRGVVHRDLKPSNVLVAPGAQLRVVDFGLGVFVEGDILSRITRTGQGVAGGSCTAPELSADPRTVDHRADIYSIGALWFIALTGKPPTGFGFERLLDEIPGVKAIYRDTLLHCLRPVDDRFQSAEELITAIRTMGTT